MPLIPLAERLFAAGLRWLSLRDKDLPASQRLDLVRALVEVARPWGAAVMLHGQAELALEAGAAGVHLPDGGPDSDEVLMARRLLGPDALIGLSAHGLDAVARAAAQGADYVTVSPVFASASKPGYGPVLGTEGLRRFVEAAPIAVLALGGIDDAATIADCRKAGAAGVAVMGAAMRGPDMVARLVEGLSGPPV
jgi:thiamine-phosphate pyrophosphorylase